MAYDTRRYNRICINCGRRIPRERREAVPETEVCVDCSAAGIHAPTVHTDRDTPLDGADAKDIVDSAQAAPWNN